MEERRGIICNIYNLRRKSRGRKVDEGSLVEEMMFGEENYDLCLNSGTNRLKRFSLPGYTILRVSFQLLAERR
jgi:hypothetical protein